MNELDQFYLNQEEPNRSCLLALQSYILNLNKGITQHWKYKAPFFYYNNKPFCYLWVDKQSQLPYIGVVKAFQINHPALIKGNRKKMKIILIDPEADLPTSTINEILNAARALY